ncbi:MAG: hypothetical protein ACO3JL_12895, partial [Myxococcota bacterium]
EQELLPRIARPLTEAVGVVTPVAPTAEDAVSSSHGAQESVVYPPMPRADRDHSVEVLEEGPYLYTARTWQASFGRVKIRQLVEQQAGSAAPRALVLEFTNDGGEPMTDLFVAHSLPPGATFVPESAHVSTMPPLEEGLSLPSVSIEDAQLLARLPQLAPEAMVQIIVDVTGLTPRALLETAPAVGRDAALPTAPASP